jgi:hypothetical protein
VWSVVNIILYLESVHNVDTLWTDFLKKRIFVAFRRENARSVRKVTDFVDRYYLAVFQGFEGKCGGPERIPAIVFRKTKP